MAALGPSKPPRGPGEVVWAGPRAQHEGWLGQWALCPWTMRAWLGEVGGVL